MVNGDGVYVCPRTRVRMLSTSTVRVDVPGVEWRLIMQKSRSMEERAPLKY